VGGPPAGDRRLTVGDGPDEDRLLALARDAARAAGAILLERFGAAPEGVGTKTSATDPVSDADRDAERAIRALLAERRPGDAILGEEEGESAARGESGVRWVVDPLDGTVNYLFGHPQWCVSVACEDAGGAIAGVVLDPLRGEEFAVTRGGRPLLNGAPLPGLQSKDDLAVALVATGFAYDADARARQADTLLRVLPRVRDVRRAGSAALDLAWTAAGRCDAYYERGVKHWDYAAGALLCARAGLAVRELPPRDGEAAGLLVAPRALLEPLAELVLGEG
jgi:myo-inositol-1(or 4)-monophosphatase